MEEVKPLSAEEIERGIEIVKAATPGPWTLEHDDTFVAEPGRSRGDWDWIVGSMANDENSDEDMRGKNIQNNCRLIAFAGTHLLALLLELKRLRETIAAVVP